MLRLPTRASAMVIVSPIFCKFRTSATYRSPTGRKGAAAASRKQVPQGYQSLADEALRSVYLASRGPNPGKPFNIIMITACLHDTASAATARGIAAAGAADGRNVLYADLDPPAGGQTTANSWVKAVDRYLSNEISLSALMKEAAPKAAGQVGLANEFGELCRVLNSKKLPDLLTALVRKGYDFIVLHAPPVLAVGDANWLAPVVDGVVLTISWGKTTEEQLVDAAFQLRLNQARLVGTVIEEVDPRIQARLGYGGSLKYYRQTQRYVQSKGTRATKARRVPADGEERVSSKPPLQSAGSSAAQGGNHGASR